MLDTEKLKKLLTEKQINQAELGERVGVTEAMISYIIRGVKKPSLEVAKRIADTLGVTVDTLIK